MSVLYKSSAKQVNNLITFKKAYSIFLALFPIISIYGFGVKGITLGDFFLIAFSIVAFLKYDFDRLEKKNISVLLFIIYIISVGLFMGVVAEKVQFSKILIRTIRLSFYLLIIIFMSKRFLDVEIFKKSIIIVSILATIYILIQYVLYYGFGIILNGHVSFVPVYVDEYSQINYEEFYNLMYRPPSFFLEPAHCARYLVVGLIILLFETKKQYKIMAFFVSVGIILTTSGQGLACLILIWTLYIIYALFISTYKNVKTVGIICFIIVFALISYLTFNGGNEIINRTMGRLFSEETLNISDGSAFGARLKNFYYVFDREFIYIIFGCGYGAVPYENAWLSALTFILYGTGFVGTIIFLCFVLGLIFLPYI